MRFGPEDYYVRGVPRLIPGAIFLNVPIIFTPPRLAAVSVAADGTLQTQEFADAWRSAPEARREEGVPVLARAKPRPVLVLRVGAAVTDLVYRGSAWVAPLYGETDPPRRGPNVFPLPVWREAGLPFGGYADLYQATMLPVQYLHVERYACELSPEAMMLILGALSLWSDADPAPGVG